MHEILSCIVRRLFLDPANFLANWRAFFFVVVVVFDKVGGGGGGGGRRGRNTCVCTSLDNSLLP